MAAATGKMRSWKKIMILLLAVLLLGAACFAIYVSRYYHALPYDTGEVQTEEYEDAIIYGDTDSEKGLIFYPGAKVEAESYAPVMMRLAEQGICCVVVKMPFHFAIFAPNAAKRLMEEPRLSGVKQWYLGGHSLGGAMAAQFAAKNEERLCGLILLAAYPTSELKELPVLSIYGSKDGVLNMEKYASAIPLASYLTEQIIDGGNHAQFGNYGEQDGDHAAEIDAKEQWEVTADLIFYFIDAPKNRF